MNDDGNGNEEDIEDERNERGMMRMKMMIVRLEMRKRAMMRKPLL